MRGAFPSGFMSTSWQCPHQVQKPPRRLPPSHIPAFLLPLPEQASPAQEPQVCSEPGCWEKRSPTSTCGHSTAEQRVQGSSDFKNISNVPWEKLVRRWQSLCKTLAETKPWQDSREKCQLLRTGFWLSLENVVNVSFYQLCQRIPGRIKSC